MKDEFDQFANGRKLVKLIFFSSFVAAFALKEGYASKIIDSAKRKFEVTLGWDKVYLDKEENLQQRRLILDSLEQKKYPNGVAMEIKRFLSLAIESQSSLAEEVEPGAFKSEMEIKIEKMRFWRDSLNLYYQKNLEIRLDLRKLLDKLSKQDYLYSSEQESIYQLLRNLNDNHQDTIDLMQTISNSNFNEEEEFKLEEEKEQVAVVARRAQSSSPSHRNELEWYNRIEEAEGKIEDDISEDENGGIVEIYLGNR